MKKLIMLIVSAFALLSCEDGAGNLTNTAPTARILGVVVRANGPVGNAQVTTDPVTQTVLTAADGTYEIRSVPNGSYVVKAVLGGESGTASVSLTSGQTGRADITLRGGDNNGGPDDSTGGPDDSTGGPQPIPGLIVHYPFDGNTADLGNTLPSGVVHGATPAADRRGQQGRAFKFDGIDDYITVDIRGPHRIQQIPVTWAIWIRHEPGDLGFEWPVGRYLHPYGDGLGFFWEKGKFSGLYSTGSFDNWCRYDGHLPADGQWHHAAFTVTAIGLTLYVDGKPQGDFDWHGRPTNTTISVPLRFGIIPSEHKTEKPKPFRGALDDFMIFDRALTLQEIQMLARR